MSLSPQQQWKKTAELLVKNGVLPDPLDMSGELPAPKPKQRRPRPPSVSFSEPHAEILQRKADAAGCSFGDYVRVACLQADYKPPHNPQLKELLLKTYKELTKQGNNLNQIARHLNSGTATLPQAESMLSILGRSLMSAHKAVCHTLTLGAPEP